MKPTLLRFLASTVALLCAAAASALAQGTAFTYQGRLNDGTNPASGTYDLRFTIHDAVTAGVQQGGTVAANAIAVKNGLFTVSLDFGNQFPGVSRWLEIAVRTNGAASFTTLVPRQSVGSMPYAVKALNADSANVANSVPNGAVGSAQLAPGAAAANLNAGGQSGVASSGLILSTTANNTALAAAGYVKIADAMRTPGIWNELVGNGAVPPPAPRQAHTAVWTGSEMIVWGGYSNQSYNSSYADGGRYSPAANTWTAMNTNGAPAPRSFHTAVWTGSEMIIWGGYSSNSFNDGGRFNPIGNSWTAVTTNGAPPPPVDQGFNVSPEYSAVWTGREMIIWGKLSAGARYNPVNNTWSAVTTNGAPSLETGHTAVWTGTEMIVFGKAVYLSLENGGRYNPAANTWSPLSTNSAPVGRRNHSAVWSGSEMIVWGGSVSLASSTTGGRYSPSGNNWLPMTTNGAPRALNWHTAVWTGSEVIFWGVQGLTPSSAGGGCYSPAGNSWVAITTYNAPGFRSQNTAVWNGGEMLTFGGSASGQLVDTFFSYKLGRPLYLYQRP